MPDLQSLLEGCTGDGPVWGAESEDLDMTLLRWSGGAGVATHVNDEVDVVMTVLRGSGTATLGGESFELRAGAILLIPKGLQRAVSSDDELVYLMAHKRRRRLIPTLGARPR